MKKHLITALCLVIALLLYAVGLVAHGTLFLLLGAVAEGTFWIRLLGRRSRRGR